MLKNHLKIAWRNLRNRKAFSVINITGLAIGMAAVMLIAMWVQHEYSYDEFHANKTTLYKAWNRSTTSGEINCWDITCGPLGASLQQNYAGIKNATRVYWPINRLFNYRDKSVKASGNDVDKPFLTMFSFPLLSGNAEHALDEVNSIVITEHLAKKIFGNEDPMNKLVKVDNKSAYKVTGVLKDLPDNTQFDFEYLVSIAGNEFLRNDVAWNSNSYNTYVQLQPNVSAAAVNNEIKNILIQHSPTAETEIFLYPLPRWRLFAQFDNGIESGGRIQLVHLLMIIGGITLLIACINFMNLSTAQSQKRAKEVGVRKAIGIGRRGLIMQFLTESVLVAFIAGILAILLVQISLPFFDQLLEKRLSIGYSHPIYWLIFIGFILFCGLVAGSYPAFFLSSFKPVLVLKGTFKGGERRLVSPRKLLVIAQFSVAIILMISTVIIYRQIKFAQNRPVGYHINNLIEVPIEGDISKNYDLIKNDLLNNNTAVGMCKTSLGVTVDGSSGSGYTWEQKSPDQKRLIFSRFGTSGNFISTMGLQLKDGRDIDLNTHAMDSAACLLNETAVAKMGIKDPVGKYLFYDETPILIVGVFKDFIMRSPYSEVSPMIVFGTKKWANNIVIRLNPNTGTAKNIQVAERVFKKYNPAFPFAFQFVDKQYEQKYNDQKQTGALAALFAGLTIFISCLGLFGLTAYMAENRSKEIGIRKVLGASVANITRMLTTEFITLVILAFILAVPVALWAMNNWLEHFSYRIQIGWATFVMVGGAAILIAILTVSAQALKAALADPVKSITAQ
jgi:putative ABC transport system permease protein